MIKTIVWNHQLDGDAERARAILDALQRTGIGALPYDPDEARDAGIVFFDRVGDPLCDFVRESSRGGATRVLAIATGEPESPAAVWRLLRAGASDVFAQHG